jgi:YbgC/YbaW family acyl-CoA thioester hydrolase
MVPMHRDDFQFAHSMRVRWAEVDRQGIVFNAHYMMYFDVGITEYYRAIGLPYPQGLVELGTDLYVKKATVEYHASAVYDDVVDMCARVGRIGRSSFQFSLAIYRRDELLVTGEIVYVNADPVTRKAAPVPETLRRAMRDFERLKPVESLAAS